MDEPKGCGKRTLPSRISIKNRDSITISTEVGNGIPALAAANLKTKMVGIRLENLPNNFHKKWFKR